MDPDFCALDRWQNSLIKIQVPVFAAQMIEIFLKNIGK